MSSDCKLTKKEIHDNLVEFSITHSDFGKEVFDRGRKLGAVEVQNKTNEIILDLLCQACDYDDVKGIIDNLCISAYENACDYLKEQGILKEINDRTYKIIKKKERGV